MKMNYLFAIAAIVAFSACSALFFPFAGGPAVERACRRRQLEVRRSSGNLDPDSACNDLCSGEQFGGEQSSPVSGDACRRVLGEISFAGCWVDCLSEVEQIMQATDNPLRQAAATKHTAVKRRFIEHYLESCEKR
jgi:hypothetical protein